MSLQIERLNCDTIDAKPIAFSFSSETYDFEETEKPGTWRLWAGIQTGEQECEACDGDGWNFCPDCDGDAEDGGTDCSTCDASGRLDCQVCDGEGRFDPDDGDPDAWMPMMNFAYPLGSSHYFELPDDWRDCLINTTIVEIDGEPYLALTGGGMDFSWEICESYIRLGYRPPSHFCELPGMAGRGESAIDRAIVEACKKSLQVHIGWLESGLERMNNSYPANDPGLMARSGA